MKKKKTMNNTNELNLYMKQVNRHPLLTKTEEKELVKLVATGDAKSRDRLITANLKFVVQIANQFKAYTNTGKYSILDLVQEGNSGLVYATSKFDYNKGYRFITYAIWWIRARIMSFIIKSHSIVKLGTTENERKLFFKIGQIKKILEMRDTEEKNQARKDLAKELGTTCNLIKKMEDRIFWNDISLEKQVSNVHPCEMLHNCLKDFLEDENSFLEETENRNLLNETKFVLKEAMKELTGKEREVIERRYLSNEGETLQSIANSHGLSRERIRQLETSAFEKLRQPLLQHSAIIECVEKMTGKKIK